MAQQLKVCKWPELDSWDPRKGGGRKGNSKLASDLHKHATAHNNLSLCKYNNKNNKIFLHVCVLYICIRRDVCMYASKAIRLDCALPYYFLLVYINHT